MSELQKQMMSVRDAIQKALDAAPDDTRFVDGDVAYWTRKDMHALRKYLEWARDLAAAHEGPTEGERHE